MVFSRSDYLNKIASEPEKTYQVKLPSGAIFELRYPPLMHWIRADLPADILRASFESQRSQGILTASQQSEVDGVTTSNAKAQAIIFDRETVEYACVSPKLVHKLPSEMADNEISPKELSEKDFLFILDWAKKGGEEAANLKTFRTKRQ